MKKYIYLEIAMFALLCVFCFCEGNKKMSLEDTKVEMIAGKTMDDGSIFIDQTADMGGKFATVSFPNVKRGTYQIRIKYDTDYSDNGLYVTSDSNSYGAINMDIGKKERPIALFGYRNEVSIYVGVREPIESLDINPTFCGAGYYHIQSIVLDKTPPYQLLVYYLLAVVFFNLALYERNLASEIRQERRMVRAGIVLIVLFAGIPLMNDFLVGGHDLPFHIYRIEGIKEGFMAGQFPVRIHPEWWEDYGYATPIFYPEGFLYIPAFVTLLTGNIQAAYKFFVFVINLLTSVIAYYSFYKISESKKIALLASALYTLSLYRLIDVYIRAAVGEYTAMTFLPLILLGIYQIYGCADKERNRGFVWLSLGMTGCIQSHLLTCEMVALLLGIFALVCIRKTVKLQIFLGLIKAVLLTLALNLWSLVPFLNMYHLDCMYKIDSAFTSYVQAQGVFFSQVFSLFVHGMYASKGGNEGTIEELGQSVGLALGLGLFLLVSLLYIYRERIKQESEKIWKMAWFATYFSVLALVLSSNLFPYDYLKAKFCEIGKYISLLQFPWRFLGLATVFLCLVSVVLLVLVRNVFGKVQVGILAGILLTLTLTGMSFYYYQALENESLLVRYNDFQAIRAWVTQREYSIIGTQLSGNPHEPQYPAEVTVENYEKQYTNIQFEYKNEGEESYVDFPLFFYDCYVAKDSDTGEKYSLTYGDNNAVRVVLPAKSEGKIVLKVQGRKLWTLSELISLFSAIGLIIYLFWGEKIKEKLTCRIKSPS